MARGQYTGGQNAPYTYPDLNSMFLATINSPIPPTNPVKVVTPSYLRPWMVDWINPAGKYTTLAAAAGGHGAGLPPDRVATTGDVENLLDRRIDRQPDSIWIDIGAPELTTAAGIRYKMLVAPLILDLDNRINVNVVGNVLANAAITPRQQPGLGAVGSQHEQGAQRDFRSRTRNEWQNIFLGNPPSGAAAALRPLRRRSVAASDLRPRRVDAARLTPRATSMP